jgi:hypothetical protein
MTNDFNLPDDIPTVDDALYRPDIQSMPIITWHGKASEHNSDTGGRWAIKADSIGEQVPEPESWWELIDMRFGVDPSAPKEPTWTTRRLRCVPIGVRKRQVITDDFERDHYFPWMTKKTDRLDDAGNLIEGKYSAHYQVMVMVPGISDPLVVALRGYTKTVCWDNNPNGQYGNKDFPKGVEPTLVQYAADASKQKKTRIPWLCFWPVDLVPVFANNNKPLWLNVGHETFMNPFQADMRVGEKFLLNSRFVGTDNFIRYQNLRRDVAMDWEAQWADASALASEGKDSAYNYDEPSLQVEEDDIPF